VGGVTAGRFGVDWGRGGDATGGVTIAAGVAAAFGAEADTGGTEGGAGRCGRGGTSVGGEATFVDCDGKAVTGNALGAVGRRGTGVAGVATVGAGRLGGEGGVAALCVTGLTPDGPAGVGDFALSTGVPFGGADPLPASHRPPPATTRRQTTATPTRQRRRCAAWA